MVRDLRLDERPPVQVISIAASFPTESSGVLEIRLAIPNPDEDPMVATHVSWEATLEDHEFASGLQMMTFEIGPREERILYLSVPLAFRRMPLRLGPVHQQIGLRGKVEALIGGSTEPRGLPFFRRMDVLCENAPIFPVPGQFRD
jgi:hypothetical protein